MFLKNLPVYIHTKPDFAKTKQYQMESFKKLYDVSDDTGLNSNFDWFNLVRLFGSNVKIGTNK